jgi:hypothetical protein
MPLLAIWIFGYRVSGMYVILYIYFKYMYSDFGLVIIYYFKTSYQRTFVELR